MLQQNSYSGGGTYFGGAQETKDCGLENFASFCM